MNSPEAIKLSRSLGEKIDKKFKKKIRVKVKTIIADNVAMKTRISLFSFCVLISDAIDQLTGRIELENLSSPKRLSVTESILKELE
jgi:hypothetical protein